MTMRALRLPSLHADRAHPAHICTGTGLAPCHICAGTGHTHAGSPLATSACGPGSPLATSPPGLGATHQVLGVVLSAVVISNMSGYFAALSSLQVLQPHSGGGTRMVGWELLRC
jgi:hypothetical protein